MSLSLNGTSSTLMSRKNTKPTNQKRNKCRNKQACEKLPPIENRSSKKLTSKAREVTPIPDMASAFPALSEESPLQRAERLLSRPLSSEVGTVMIRFNHYHKLFPIYNSVLKWESVDEVYCLSFIHKGNYRRELIKLVNPNPDTDLAQLSQSTRIMPPPIKEEPIWYSPHDDEHRYFLDLQCQCIYLLELPDTWEGSEESEIGARKGVLSASQLSQINANQSIPTNKGSGNIAVKEITKELRNIDPTQLNESYAKDLIERRDIEDILFSVS